MEGMGSRSNVAPNGKIVMYPWEKPLPEVRAILKEWCDMQRMKYGPDWKRILAREMVEKQAPVIDKLFALAGPHVHN